jgi:hypothetical protein
MATLSTAILDAVADDWEEEPQYPSAVCSGIVGDKAHADRGGYHISIQDQPSTNFSVVLTNDKAPPGTWPRNRASAIDMSMSKADMKKCHNRLKELYRDRATDPRAKYIRAFNGWDGTGSPGRYDLAKGTITTATIDHTWHEHVEFYRRYANDPQARRAFMSKIRGESIAEYLGEDPVTPAEQDAIAAKTVALFTAQLGDETRLRSYMRAAAVSYDGRGLPGGLATEAVPQPSVLHYFTHLVQTARATFEGFKTFVEAEAARDAQEAARDAAAMAVLERLATGAGATLSPAQFAELKTYLGQKIAEAGSDAVDGIRGRLDHVAEVLAEAGQALTTADDNV